MRCEGEFVFKSVNKRDGGEFTNDKGNAISYDPMYILKLDEQTERGIQERTFKFPTTNTELYDTLVSLDAYTKINVLFEIVLYNSQAKLLPIKIM